MSMTAAQRKVYTQGPEYDNAAPIEERVPEHSERAEVSVLGSMLIDCKACALAIKMLMPHHFYSPKHRWLYGKFASMYLVEGKLDEVLVAERLRPVMGAKARLGRDYIGRLVIETPTAANVENYCEIVMDCYERREVRKAALMLVKAIDEGHEPRVLAPQFIECVNGVLVERGTKDESAAVDQEIKDEIEGRRFNVQIPKFPCLSTVKMFLPGCVVALVGTPGSGKSSMLLEWFWRWEFCGIRVACLMLESGAAFHLRRCLAQLAERTELLDDVWCRRNADEAKSLQAQWAAQKDRVAKTGTIQAMPRGATCAHLVRWMDQEFRDGRRILGIDPLAAMAGQEKRFLDQEKLLGESQNLAEKYKGTVLYAMHPKPLGRGERRRPCLEQLPGSSDFQKFLDAAVWLSAHDPLEADFPAVDEFGRTLADQVKEKREYNRTLTVLKKRRAGGWMPIIGANMNGKTLWTQECGWL